jgi:hypothetical protein
MWLTNFFAWFNLDVVWSTTTMVMVLVLVITMMMVVATVQLFGRMLQVS